jgi:pimeloyl-ACP methyl ester carboxylesterase
MPYAEINGARLHYDLAGDGADVALLHSTVCDSGMWDADLDALSQRYRVLRYDLRGYGRSELPPGPFSLVHDLRALLNIVEMERPALVGVSAGATLALDFALAHPERVRALVLAAPGIGGLEWGEEIRRFGEEEDALLEAGDLDAAVELNLRLWVDGPRRGPDAVAPDVRRQVGEMQHRAFEVLLAAYEQKEHPGPSQRPDPPAVQRLEEVAVPTLVLVGDADVQDVLDRADLLEARIPNARKVVLENVAHMVNLERPEQFRALVTECLESL